MFIAPQLLLWKGDFLGWELVNIPISLIVTRFSLRKVFFKKYKKFELETQFDKVEWKLATQIWLIIGLAGIAICVLFSILFLESVGSSISSVLKALWQFVSIGDESSQLILVKAIFSNLLMAKTSVVKQYIIAYALATIIFSKIAEFFILRHYILRSATVTSKEELSNL
jgi:hypothetical protein